MKYLAILLVLLTGCAGTTARNTRSKTEKAVDATMLVKTADTYRTFCSATVIGRTGLALSAWHCFSDGEPFVITYHKQQTTAKIIAVDIINDIVVLRPDLDLDFLGVQLARKAPRAGDTILALGHAQGDVFPFSFTSGIVSYPRRDDPQVWMQGTAPLLDGMSGGGTYNTRGELVGVNLFVWQMGVRCMFGCPGVMVDSPFFGYAHLETITQLLASAQTPTP